MSDKIKISKKEFEEIYDVIPDIEDTKDIPEESENKNFTFEEYTEHYDKDDKRLKENAT